MARFSFRLHFVLSPRSRIEASENRVLFNVPGYEKQVVLAPPESSIAISEARDLTLTGEHFSSEDEALSSGRLCTHALMLALAHCRVGADFGDESQASSGWTEYGLRFLGSQAGQKGPNQFSGPRV